MGGIYLDASRSIIIGIVNGIFGWRCANNQRVRRILTKTEVITWIRKRIVIMVILEDIGIINRMMSKNRRIQRRESLVDFLLVLTLLGLLTQMELGISTTIRVALIKSIPTFGMKPVINREQTSNFLQITHLVSIWME